jgi:DNA-binding MarR family transcriptional regulator
MSARSENFGFLIGDVARMLRQRFDRALVAAGLGLTPGEARALAHAARTPGLRQNALAERMNVEPMTLVGFLDRLEAAALIERLPDPGDRRAKLVYPTAAAAGEVERIAQIGASARESATAGFSAEDVEKLRDLLIAMRANLVAALAADREPAPAPAEPKLGVIAS